jgi:hypothetical protein
LHYRLYRLNPATGGIVSGSDVEAADDAAAIAIAHAQLGESGAPFELWRGTQRIYEHGSAPKPR